MMITRIGDVLKDVIEKDLQLPRAMVELKIAALWERVGEQKMAQNTAFDSFSNGVLFVVAKSPAWGQQVNLLKGGMISKLNAALGEDAIKDIRIKSGTIAAKKDETEPRKAKSICLSCLWISIFLTSLG